MSQGRLHFDLNVSLTLRDTPPLERFDAAARLGFGAVEFWWPAGEDLRVLTRRVKDAGLDVALFNFAGGDLARGERGLLNHPERQAEFRANVPVALELAVALGCPRLNALVGRWLPDLHRELQLELVRENLRFAAEAAAPAGVTVLVESLNTWDTPGFLLPDTATTLALIASVGVPNLRYQYDTYHMQRMEGNITATIAAHAALIGHIQVADSPHRGQPGTGELRFGYIFEALAASGYTGMIGLEFVPRGSVEESLAWLPPDRRGSIALADLRL